MVDSLEELYVRPTKVNHSVRLTEVERGLSLCYIRWETMADSTGSSLRGGALTWINSLIDDTQGRGQPAVRNWQEFMDAFL